MLLLYRLLTLLLSPFLFLYLLIRRARGLEARGRFLERLGLTKLSRPEGKLIWLNAVSMGEINSAWTIVSRINRKNECNILITTTSQTGAAAAMGKIESLDFPERVIHQYAPIDFFFSLRCFLRRWRPNLLVNVESEFWPNMFTMAREHCPIIVLNGKLSRRSFRFWYRFRGLKERVFSNIDLCLAQSKVDYRKFLNLGVQNVQFLGNIKFFVAKSPVNVTLYERLLREVGGRERWFANCTHRGEEELVLEVHRELRRIYPNLITFLVARHAERTDEVLELLRSAAIKYATTSQGQRIGEEIEFYVHDGYGDLGTFFDLCKIVFIGGSMVDGVGGHTPAESIKHHCCVVTGPSVENNLMLFKELEAVDGCLVLKEASAARLFSTISFLLASPAEVERISKNAYLRSLGYNGVLNEIVELLMARLS
ncbi:MAG: hypothetical protein LBU15_00705 [Rickettsiales bacterium]|jgi:3-deoxy-D-manno-octulosonic-acid transferase|nr:hypothetical protein [Rickettsiales bacterium]